MRTREPVSRSFVPDQVIEHSGWAGYAGDAETGGLSAGPSAANNGSSEIDSADARRYCGEHAQVGVEVGWRELIPPDLDAIPVAGHLALRHRQPVGIPGVQQTAQWETLVDAASHDVDSEMAGHTGLDRQARPRQSVIERCDQRRARIGR